MKSLEAAWVLVHSPLVGPLTWSLVAAELEARGAVAVAPALRDSETAGRPFWQQEAASAAQAAGAPERPLILAGHSGAGVLLPPIRQALGRPVAAYLFVDAGLPANDRPRLAPDTAPDLYALVAGGGRYPDWSDADLADEVPDAALRRRLLAQMQPRALPFWEERVPAFEGWPDAPCGYLLFSSFYAPSAGEARRLGWPVRELPGGHFMMLREPRAVAEALLELADACLDSALL